MTTEAANTTTTEQNTPTTQTESQPQDWTAGLSPETKGYVQNKGFKDPAAVVESYRNFEKLMGVPQDRIMKIPEKAEDKDGWNAIYNKLGRPEKADQYTLKAEGSNPEAVKWAQETFHELGLTRRQAETLFEKFNGFSGEAAKAQQTALELEAQKQETELKREWGAEFEQRIQVAKAAANKFGLDGATIDSLEKAVGFQGIMKFLHAVGSSVGEDSFVTSDKKGSQISGKEAALQRIADLKKDTDFYTRLSKGGVNEKNEWDRLHIQAYSS